MINVTTLGMKAEEVRRLGTQALLDGECLDGFDILDGIIFTNERRARLLRELSRIMNGLPVSSGLGELLISVVKEHVDDVVLFLED